MAEINAAMGICRIDFTIAPNAKAKETIGAGHSKDIDYFIFDCFWYAKHAL